MTKGSGNGMLDPSQAVGVNKAAAVLGVSVSTVRNRIYEDQETKAGAATAEPGDLWFPYARKGGNGRATSRWLIFPQDLQHYQKRLGLALVE